MLSVEPGRAAGYPRDDRRFRRDCGQRYSVGGPIGGVSVGLVDGEIVINPNQEQRAVSKLSLTVAGTDEAVLMVEAGAKEISEADMLRAILTGHEEIKKLVAFQKQIVAEIGKEKRVFPGRRDGRRREGCRSRGLLRPLRMGV